MSRRFGEIEGYPEGSWFGDFTELRLAGLHTQLQRGISGDKFEGADSIVLNGG